MAKLKTTKRSLFIVICDTLNDTYGDTLHDGGTDMDMALAVLKKISPYIDFQKETVSIKEMRAWRLKLIEDYGQFEPEDRPWEDELSKICRRI